MRRKDREMSPEFGWGIVNQCDYATLSMVTPGGEAYCVPLSIVRSGETVYFHAATQGEKTDCLRCHPDVCILCVGSVRPMTTEFSTEFESAILRGSAREVLSDEEKRTALRLLCQRYVPSHMAAFEDALAESLAQTAVWAVEVSSITAKRKKIGRDGRELKFGKME